MGRHDRLNLASETDRMFAALAESVKMPLVQIAHLAENAQSDVDRATLERILATIEATSAAAMQTIDSYLLSTQLAQGTLELNLEPTSVSSVLYDVSERLNPYARAHGCELRLQLHGKIGPVMAHQRALEAAVTALGISFIEGSAGTGRSAVDLAAYRNNRGITVGVFSGIEGLSSDMLKRARVLYGRSRQPLGAFTGGSAGVYVAESLFQPISGGMRTAQYRNLAGLAATMLPSRQLCLV